MLNLYKLLFLILILFAEVAISYKLRFSEHTGRALLRRFRSISKWILEVAVSPDFSFVSSTHLDLSQQMKVSEFLERYGQESMSGVFLISDIKDEIQYVSVGEIPIQEELVHCLETQGAEKVHSIRVQTFSVSNKAAIDAYRTELLNQLGVSPPGNTVESAWYQAEAVGSEPKSNTAANDLKVNLQSVKAKHTRFLP